MKKTITFFKCLLLAVALLVGSGSIYGQYSGTGTFTKITSLTDLTDGYYVIVNSGDAVAMNNSTTQVSGALGYTAVAPSSGAITNPATSIVWKIETNGTGRTIYNEATSKYISYTGSSNNVQVVDAVTANNQRWTFAYSSNVFSAANVALTTRILQYNSSSPRFACYTSSQQKLLLYKMAATCTTPTFTFASTSVSKLTTDAAFTNTFTSNNTSTKVWSSTNEAVATVDLNGEVTIVGAGSTNIRVNQAADATYCAVVDASYALNVTNASAPAISVTETISPFSAQVNSSSQSTIHVNASNLTGDITLALSGTNQALFSLDKTSISPTSGTVTDEVVTITYSPTSAGSHSATLTLSTAGATDVTKSLTGTAVYAEPSNQPTGLTATANSSSQITVTWTDASGAQVPAGYIVKAAADPSSPTAPVDGTAEADATLVKNIAQGTQQAVFTGLSASTTYNFSIWPYTNSAAAINYKTDGTVATASTATSASLPPTVLNVGDIAILQVNTVTTDRIAFVTFVDLNPGTVISFTDNGFTSTTTVRTGEGFLIYTAPTHVPAGTVVSWYNGMTITGTGWNSANPSNFALGGGDQLFAYQGTWGSSQTLIYGVSLSPWVTSGGSSSITFLPSALTDNVNAFCFAASKDNAYYTNITSGTANALKSLITYNTNWATATTNQGAQTWAFALGTSTSLTTNSSVNNLVIATGETFVIGAAKQLTVNGTATNNGTINIQSDATGTGTIVGNVSGTATVNQHLSSYRTWYLSSPVSNVTPANMNRYKFYDEATNTWTTTAPAQTIGAGFLAVPTDNAVTSTSFSGTLNNGAIAIPLTYSVANTLKHGFNLVGNPYPSYLDWTAVYAANTSNLSTSTLWYRTKAGAYTFWTVNGESGEGSPAAATKEIAPMQAFWVRTAANGSLNLSNTLRGHAPAGGSLLKAPAANSNTLIRFEVSNGTNTDETVLYFNANASNEFDVYDSPKMSNEDADIAEIYTRAGNERLVMNGMPTIQKDAEIALGFEAGSATSFSLRANEVRNLASDVKVILKDNVTQTETDLTDGATVYAFGNLTASGDRFSIIFRTAGAVTGIETPAADGLTVYNSGREQLTVLYNGAIDARTTVSVYNAVGQRLANQLLTGTTTVVNGKFIPGVYVVKVNNLSRKLTIKN